jgi:hypothetical protein
MSNDDAPPEVLNINGWTYLRGEPFSQHAQELTPEEQVKAMLRYIQQKYGSGVNTFDYSNPRPLHGEFARTYEVGK